MDLFWLFLAWLVYALLHSVLAAFTVKAAVGQRWPAFMPWYRLVYNLIAIVTILPLGWLIHAMPGDWLWRWTGIGTWLANGLALAACAGFLLSARYYAMDEFIGMRQIRERAAQADRPDGFAVSPFHRFVRHPWYCFALVLVWTRDMTPALLLSALAITLYFVVGSRLEEKKLLALHGEKYRRYRARVPALFPLPWKTLGRDEAQNI